jgi:hypothetical protein
MKHRNLSSLFYLFIIVLTTQSCKEEIPDEPAPTAFTYTAADSLVFEHSGTLSYPVSVQSSSGKEFISSFSEFTGSFSSNNTTLYIPSNGSDAFDVVFNQFGISPGVYPCKLTVAVPNENNAVKTKTVQMVYRPNCGYAFRNYTIAEITYEINGILLNKSITCSYNFEGQLEVEGLAPYTIELIFNCSNATVTMVPLIHLGSVVTCSGTIEGTEIALQFFNDGELNSVGRIKF